MANPGQPQFSAAREPGTASPLNLPEMEKLLVQVGGQDDKSLKPSKSLSGPLDLEQNGHSLPFKVISEEHREALHPLSSSRASSRRASSTATTSYAQDGEVPKDYLILAIASCFCPVWPLNLMPLIFSIMERAVASLPWTAGPGAQLPQGCSSGGNFLLGPSGLRLCTDFNICVPTGVGGGGLGHRWERMCIRGHGWPGQGGAWGLVFVSPTLVL
ncbi:hypothetical protein E5288_WYG020846 [Bos mutus]|uniref:Tumor suppressor candidate 5 n=1 Tax=Bos mutus TaxID=72004 RepID=A0A6B0R361_9CETA|nr:hypothetical protein [Bos mutus]